MPQNPLAANVAKNPSNALVPLLVDSNGALKTVAQAAPTTVIGTVNTQAGVSSALNLSASTAIKAAAGRLYRVSVITAGSAPGAVHDIDTIGGAAAGNKIGVIPNTVGIYSFDWPCTAGITYILGTGQVVSVSYS